MMQAQRTHEDAVNQCEQSKRVHGETVNDNHEMYNELNNSMEQKVADSQNLVAKLEDRAQCLENSIQLTCQSLADLESATRAKDPPLQLCLWRLEQRARRPTREQVRDTAEVSLEEERSTLVSIKWELGDAAERTKATIADLRRKLGDVRHDLEHKMHALGIDEMCLTTAQASFLSMSLRTPRPAAGAVPGMRSTDRAAQLESRKNEQLRQFKASTLDRGAAAREDSATALRDQNAELIYRSAARAQEAKMRSDRATQERVSETQMARMRLEQEIQETDAHIDHTNGTMAETRFHLNALEEPMAMANVCNNWRQGRTAPEHIADPVSAKLHEHHSSLLKAHDNLAQQHHAEKGNLEDLYGRRRQLVEDLKDKTASQQIDSRCLVHGSAPRASSSVRTHEKAANPMPLPIHGDPIPGNRPTINGFGTAMALNRSVTPGRTGFKGASRTDAMMGATAPGYLSSWKLARNGAGTMTPRGFGATGNQNQTMMPMTARASLTY